MFLDSHAPFQGFVVTASGGAGYITIQEADKSNSRNDGASDGSSYLEFTTGMDLDRWQDLE